MGGSSGIGGVSAAELRNLSPLPPSLFLLFFYVSCCALALKVLNITLFPLMTVVKRESAHGVFARTCTDSFLAFLFLCFFLCKRSRFRLYGSVTALFLLAGICSGVSFHVVQTLSCRWPIFVCLRVCWFSSSICFGLNCQATFASRSGVSVFTHHPLSPERCLCRFVPLYLYVGVCLPIFVMSVAPRLVDPSSLGDSRHSVPPRLLEPRRTRGGGAARRRSLVISSGFFVCFRLLFFVSSFLSTWPASVSPFLRQDSFNASAFCSIGVLLAK